MTNRKSHYEETLFKTKEQPVATTNQEEREVLYADATGTYKLVESVRSEGKLPFGWSCLQCSFGGPECHNKKLVELCASDCLKVQHFEKVTD